MLRRTCSGRGRCLLRQGCRSQGAGKRGLRLRVTTAAIDDETRKRDNGIGRLITALGVAQIFSWGSLYYSFALVAEAMRLDLGWSKTEIYGAATLGLACAGVAAFPVGAAIDRGQGRFVMAGASVARSEEHTSELQSLMRISYAVFCLKKKT